MIGSRAVRQGTIARPHVGQLAAGVRASRGKVGYIDSQIPLTVLNVGDPLPGGWSAVWDTGALVIAANNVTIDHYRINAVVVFTGNNPTMTNCKVYPNADDIFGVTLSGSGKGVLTITDTTIVGNATGANPQVNGISSDSGLVARRCDVSRTGDGIHIVAQPSAANAIISQCYIHDQAYVNESQHVDGIQVFNYTAASFFTIEHNYVGRTLSTIGTPMNGAITAGPPSNNSEPYATPIVNNNFFEAGTYHMRLNFRLRDMVVTNNDFGPLHASEFGLQVVEVPASLAAWSNNRDASGNTIASPYTPAVPTIKEVLQTSDGLTGQQILTTSAGLTAAGDTLLIIYATDNNTASLPTSSAGTLTQIGTTEVDGDATGLLRAFVAPVATDGSKTVTMPNAGGADVMGAVFLIQGGVFDDGFVKTNFTNTTDNFNTPSATFVNSANLLVTAMFNTDGRTFSLGAGLTQRANPKCLPFASLTVGTAGMSSSGASPTYSVTMDDIGKPGVIVFGIKG